MIDRPLARPRHDREFGRELFDLPPPRRQAVPHIAVEEDEWWSIAGAFVADAEPVNLDHLHGASPPQRVRPVTFAQMPVKKLALQADGVVVSSDTDLSTAGRTGRPYTLRVLPARTGCCRPLPCGMCAGSLEAGGRLRLTRQQIQAYLQDFYGSDGTRTRDLRRDRPAF